MKKNKKSKLVYDGFYFDGRTRFDLYKNEKGKIFKKKNGQLMKKNFIVM